MTQQVVIHCKPSLFNFLYKSDLVYSNNSDEIDVLVDNIDSLEDDELCEHYGIDYEQVNCIELA